MNILREAAFAVFWILVGVFFVGGLVVGISAVMPPRGSAMSQTEADFRAACVAVKGNAVWTGRHWECLK